jgi:hypothetical protein
MKGVSLPINTTVIVIVAVICLVALVIAIIYYSQRTPKYDVLYRLGCLQLITNCEKSTAEIQVNSADKPISLSEICNNLGMDDDACKKGCGCQ